MKRKKFEAAAMAAILAAMSLNGSLIHVSAAENNGSEDDFANQIAAEFSQPEMKYKPYARWWLAEGSHTDETLRESVQELYDDGYGGIEFVTLDESQYLDKETYAWGSSEWIHDTKVIIEECNRLGMSVSMTSGTHWSTANLISITPDEEAASQELGVSPRVEYKEANTKLLPVMRSAEDADYLYLYHYMYEDEENYEGEISLDGIYEPYVIDTWSGNVEKVQGVSYEDGRTVLHVDAAPGETMVFALKHGDDGENSVELIEAENSGEGTRNEAKDIADTKSEVEKNVSKNAAGAKEKEGNEAVDELQEKSSINNVLTLSNWNLTIDSYEPGEKVTRTEENEDTGVTTTEAAYTTNHVEIDVGTLAELVSWKDIESVGETVSGIGTYTTTFELPDEWQIAENTEASEGDTESASSEAAKTNSGKIEFQADSFQGGTAAIWINDTKVPVNMDRRTADRTAYIQPGENTITVRVTSSLRNIMITQGYDGWIFGTPDPDDYGMTGETKLVYTK